MTADRRFPNMHPVDGRRLPGIGDDDARQVTSWAKRVAHRTSVMAWWNEETRAVHFCPGDIVAAPYAPRLMREDMVLRLPSEDDAARSINVGKMSARRKDRLIAEAKRRGAHDRTEKIERVIEDATPDMRDRAAHRINGRTSVLVP